jgi:hypothetical protein
VKSRAALLLALGMLPAFRGAAGEGARAPEAYSPAAPCRVGIATSFCLIVLPSVPTARLALEIAGGGGVTYRLYDARRGWSRLESASAPSARGTLHLSSRQGSFDRDGILLLELSASEDPPPRLLGYRLEAPSAVASIASGPKSPQPLPPLPLSAQNPRAPLEGIGLARAWPVRAPGARPGDIVRIGIPDPVHAESQGFSSNLHLETHGREIHYITGQEPETVPLVWLPGVSPRPTGQAGISQVDLLLPGPGLPLATLHLRARSLPFSRKVQVIGDSAVVDEQDWICAPDQPGPCALDVDISWRLRQYSHLRLRFLDGDNPPLRALDVAGWRRRESLAFVWPRSGPVRLLTGAKSTDLSDRNDDELDRAIDSRPPRPGFVELPRRSWSSAAPAFGAAGVLLLALVGWRSRRRLRPALALAALAILPAAVRADAGRLYTRPVAVPSAGVVRVPLDLATLRHLGANGAGLRVFGPNGEEVPGWVQPYIAEDPQQAFWASRVQPGVRQEGPAVVLAADLTPTLVPLHDRLWLEYGGPGSVQHLRARVEVSGDRQTWRPLAEGDFFEGLPAGSRQKTLYLLAYPPSRDPFVRVTIPRGEATGFQGADLGVFGVIPRILSVPVDRLKCESARQRTWCRLELPARWQRPVRLALDLAGPEEMAIRVYSIQEGRLSPLVQAVRRPAGGSSRFILPIISGPLEAEALRIEIQGEGGAPGITGATLDLVQPVAVFRAASPGVYELRYGDGRFYEGRNTDSPPSDAEESAWIAPGPESARELPPLPRGVSSPGVPLDGRFVAAWPVHAAGAKPGDVVRLEIPAEVYARSRSFGNDLRLSAGDRQIPYVRQTADDPALALSRHGLRPKHPWVGEEQVDVPLPQPGLPLTTWQVTFGPQAGDPENVTLWFAYKKGSAYGMAYGKTDPLLPTRLEGDLEVLRGQAGPRAPEIRLAVKSPVDLALWRSRDILVFVWPREGPVVLRAGGDAGAPQYDLRLFASDLLARPWRAAALGRKEPEIPLLRLLALLAGASVALILLRRALPAA